MERWVSGLNQPLAKGPSGNGSRVRTSPFPPNNPGYKNGY